MPDISARAAVDVDSMATGEHRVTAAEKPLASRPGRGRSFYWAAQGVRLLLYAPTPKKDRTVMSGATVGDPGVGGCPRERCPKDSEASARPSLGSVGGWCAAQRAHGGCAAIL